MNNQYIDQLKQGSPFEITYDSFGKPVCIHIRSENSSTSIPLGNDHFDSVIEYVRAAGIFPKPSIEWVSLVKDGEGRLLHYLTNIGLFVVDSNYVTDYIVDMLSKNEVEIREVSDASPIVTVHADIFLPRNYTLNGPGMSRIEHYDFNSRSLGLPISVDCRLLASIEDEYFKDADVIRSQVRYSKGNVLRIVFDGREMRAVYKWSKDYLDKGEGDNLAASMAQNIALHNRGSRGPTTGWYFDWISLQQYIWVPILEISNRLIDLINRQAHRKTTALLSRDDLGDMACLRAIKSDETSYLWPLSSLRDEQITLFPFELNWGYHPIEKSFQRVRFLLDRGLYFEAIIVAQAALEGVVNQMFTAEVRDGCYDGKEPKWEVRYRALKKFIDNDASARSLEQGALRMYLDTGLNEIYDLRNHYAHDVMDKIPEYTYSSQVMHQTRELLRPLTDSWESHLFLRQVGILHSLLPNFKLYLDQRRGE
ncbi:hypothetical protein M3A49_24355 [Paraburkholderia sp. CNPSo 3076]|uniref:hypothetical protein n=1 Tax=Paraburkholderia sp. CNPSo 3076 TaxID=2940936 RepID=UPI00224EE3E8|nr:hypothetical protein [Paraburkholderia sp. CNPSo 3076]MCX5542593.1 hypothetical protein [Paraburkholderia sp. CNPSo 3076]